MPSPSPSRRTWVLCGLALSLLAIVAPLAWKWHSPPESEHAAWFNQVVLRRGLLEGVGPVAEDDLSHRRLTYRLTSRGGRLVTVEAINGLGEPAPTASLGQLFDGVALAEDAVGEPTLRFRLDGRGRPAEVEALDLAGDVAWSLVFDSEDRAHFVDRRGFPAVRPGTGIAGIRWKWSAEGWPARIDYLGRDGSPKAAGNGLYGVLRGSDILGLPAVDSWLGERVETWHPSGYQTVARQFDERGNVTALRYSPSGPHEASPNVKRTYDEYDRLVREEFRDEQDRPTRNRDGASVLVMTSNDRGEVAEVKALGLDGKPALTSHGSPRVAYRHDGLGQVVEIRHFDALGKPTCNNSGVHTVLYTRDQRGRVVEERYLDRAGRPAWHADGYTRVHKSHDAAGNVVAETYHEPDGRPAWHRLGYARVEHVLDSQDRVREEIYTDPAGKPVVTNEGYARLAVQPGPHGMPEEVLYLGPGGELTLGPEGVAGVRTQCSSDMKHIEATFLGLDGKKAKHADGYESVTLEMDGRGRLTSQVRGGNGPIQGHIRESNRYDPHGRVIETRYSDRDGKPTANQDGYAREQKVYDKRGNAILVTYHGADGRPGSHREGYAQLRTTFDERGRTVLLEYLDEAQRPTRHRDGYYREARQHDVRGRVVERTFQTADGRPIANSEGVTRIRQRWDTEGRAEETSYHDGDGRLTRHRRLGYARVVQVFGARRRPTAIRYFSETGEELRARMVVTRVRGGGVADAGIREGDLLRMLGGIELGDELSFLRNVLPGWNDEPRELILGRGTETIRLQVGRDALLDTVEIEDRVIRP